MILKLYKLRNLFHTFLLKRSFLAWGSRSRIDYPATVSFPKSIRVGNKVLIREHAWLNCAPGCPPEGALQIGDRCYIGRFAHINAYHSVILEEAVLVSDRVFISDVHHQSLDETRPIMDQGVTPPKPVRLKTGCWIGIGAVIMPGVTIGKNAIVAANAVVTKDVPDFKIARGIPAQIFERSGKEIE